MSACGSQTWDRVAWAPELLRPFALAAVPLTCKTRMSTRPGLFAPEVSMCIRIDPGRAL